MFRISGLIVLCLLVFFGRDLRADDLPPLRSFSVDARQAGEDVIESCKTMGTHTVRDMSYAAFRFRLKGGANLIVFDPTKLCDESFKGNGVCTTDGCEIYVLKEELQGFWTTILHQPVTGMRFDPEVDGKPFQLVIDMRGGVSPCNKPRSSTCIFELNWIKNGFNWKQLR